MHSNAAGCAVSMAPGAGGKLSKPADVPLACEPPSACLRCRFMGVNFFIGGAFLKWQG